MFQNFSILLVLVLNPLLSQAYIRVAQPHNVTRQERMFSFFGSSKSTDNDVTCSSGTNSGICVPSSRCKSKGGESFTGSDCSSGLSCCRFTVNCTSSIRSNDPCSVKLSGTSVMKLAGLNDYRITYRYRKPKGVCQLRLDFDDFVLADPSVNGDCSTEFMQVKGLSICGSNAQQHVYFDYGETSNIDVSMRIRTGESKYTIRNTYIPCNSDKRAPEDCLQYFTTPEGTVRSFNFVVPPSNSGLGNRQTNNQVYSVCVKAANGMNRIQWKPCQNVAKPFFISGGGNPPQSGDCTRDWVQVYSQERVCGTSFPTCTSNVKPFLLNVNFDQAEGFAVTLPTSVENCYGMIMDPYSGGTFNCDPMPLNNPTSCTCELIPPAPALPAVPYVPDMENTGFCLDYLQLA